MRVNEIAAYIHRQMVTDNRFGYSWEERFGANPETWTIDGKQYSIRVGDYDCSSSCITAWAIALRGTAYEGCLKDATYTGNMRAVFTRSGLFEWKPMSFLAEPGDLYLNEANHVAMCQTQYPDVLSEFSWGDNGAYGNQRGDQSGYEAHLADYYDYPWDGILHYNGKADASTPAPAPTGQPVYNAYVDDEWLDTMDGLTDTGGSGDDYAGIMGLPIQFLAIEGVGKYRVATEDGGWLEYVHKRDLSDFDDGCAGDSSAIIAVEIPNKRIKFRVHTFDNGWLPWMVGTRDTGGGWDTFAGDYSPIDAIQITLA